MADELTLYPFDPQADRVGWVPAELAAWPSHVDENNGRGVLYRFYDENGVLLYLGTSTWPFGTLERWKTHSATAWWSSAAHVSLEFVVRNWRQRFALEREAIRRERPLHNVMHNRKRVQMSIRLDEGWDALIESLRFHMLPEDFVELVAAFKALPDQEGHL